MYFDGHWLSLKLVNTMFWVWGLEVLAVVVFFCWFLRRGHRLKSQKKALNKINRSKRRGRNKRGLKN